MKALKVGKILTVLAISSALLTSCSSKVLQVENSERLLKIDDYDKTLQIKEAEKSTESEVKPTFTAIVEKKEELKTDDPFEKMAASKREAEKKAEAEAAAAAAKPAVEAKKPEVKKEKPAKLKAKLPSLEDSEGFDGRRPIVDPFRPGEKVTIKLSYFNVVAGEMIIEVLPFKVVNGKKSYHFKISGKSNSFFSSVYAVDDQAETFMDYETLLPYNMAVDVKETKQLRTVRSYFDWKKMKAFFWEKKITKKHGVEEKNIEWKIEPYAQNIFSSIFYLRTFTLTPGKVIQFRMADNKKNMVVKVHVLRRETIKTEIGDIKTVVVKPELAIDGVFKPMGDVFFWLTDDDRKFVVRIESKIKIGTIIGSLKEIIP